MAKVLLTISLSLTLAAFAGQQAAGLTIVLASPRDTSDSRPMIQQALDTVALLGGGTVFLKEGDYYIGPADGATPPSDGAYSLQLGSNTHLKLDQDATIIRRFTTGGEIHATIRNKNLDFGNEHIRVTGGTIKTDNALNAGKHLGFVRSSYLSVSGVRFKGVFDEWNTSFVDCNDVTISGVVMDSGDTLTEDGLHFTGGSRIAIDNCVIRSGDDCIAFVQTGPGPHIEETTEVTDVVISNCYLHSRAANALKFRVGPAATLGIRRVRVSNIVAKCGVAGTGDTLSGGIEIWDETHLKRVSDIELDGVTLDASENQRHPLIIEGAERVRLARVVLKQPNLRTQINGCVDVELRDCVVDSPRSPAENVVWVAETLSCANIRFVGGHYWTGVSFAHAIQLGNLSGSLRAVNGFEVSNTLIDVSGELNANGLHLYHAFDGIVIGNRITGGNGGIQEFGSSNRNVIIANRLASLALAGTNATEAIRNVTALGFPMPDTGGFRQTIDGWFRNGNLTGAMGEIERFTGGTTPSMRFRAVRAGSLTGVVIGSNMDWTAGTLTATVFKNTGLAGAPGGTTGFFAKLDSVNKSRHAATQSKDVDTFVPGDELYIDLTASGWTPTNARISVALEIED